MSVPTAQLGEQLIALLPRLRRLARVILETDPDAEAVHQCADDLVQTCIEQTVRSPARWQEQRELENDLFGRLTRACTAACLRAARAAGMRRDDPACSATLRSSYAALPLQQRAAIALVVLEQRSYHDAALMLEIPVPALTQQLWQGRAALQAQLRS